MSNEWSSNSTTASSFYDGYYMKKTSCKLRGSDEVGPSRMPHKKPVEADIKHEDIAEELKRIAIEEEEDKQKYLPVFDPEDLDL
jgi:hypothetical protein